MCVRQCDNTKDTVKRKAGVIAALKGFKKGERKYQKYLKKIKFIQKSKKKHYGKFLDGKKKLDDSGETSLKFKMLEKVKVLKEIQNAAQYAK